MYVAFTMFPTQMHGRPLLNLQLNEPRSSQGHGDHGSVFSVLLFSI